MTTGAFTEHLRQS